MNRLILIDGNAIMHRAYHALPPLTTKEGKPVNAVYGFVSMLLRVISDLKPTHIAVAFDRPEPTFRKELFKDYQAHRPAMVDDLGSQFALVKEVVEVMSIPIFEQAGFEADDVIGTIAKKCQMSNVKCQIVIVTGDRDMLQLVDDSINLYMPIKGLTEAKLYDREAVKQKFGVLPEQVVDYKALVGDASDNYPGVAGIGPKTAVTLLSHYKTLENIYKHLDKETNMNVVEKLKTGEKSAKLGKQLATIVTDVPLEINLDHLPTPVLDSDQVVKLFEKLGFHSLMKRLMVAENESESKKTKEETKTTEQLSLV